MAAIILYELLRIATLSNKTIMYGSSAIQSRHIHSSGRIPSTPRLRVLTR